MTKILIDRSTVEQALEALEEFCEHQTMLRPIEKRESLKAALAEPVQEPQGCDHCNHPLYAATKCRVCGRVTEAVQEPVAWRFEARHIDSAWAAAVTLKHPGPEGIYMRNVMPLYAHPPQRKPLTEEEIKACEKQAMVNGALPFEQRVFFARAIERAHGIT